MTDFWKNVKEKALGIGLDPAYFILFDSNEAKSCPLKNTELKRCKYIMTIEGEAGCSIKIDHSNEEWNRKVFNMVQSCSEELEKTIGVALSFEEAENKIGLFKNPSSPETSYNFGEQSNDDISLHLLRCFFILLEEVDHVVANSIKEIYN